MGYDPRDDDQDVQECNMIPSPAEQKAVNAQMQKRKQEMWEEDDEK